MPNVVITSKYEAPASKRNVRASRPTGVTTPADHLQAMFECWRIIRFRSFRRALKHDRHVRMYVPNSSSDTDAQTAGMSGCSRQVLGALLSRFGLCSMTQAAASSMKAATFSLEGGVIH